MILVLRGYGHTFLAHPPFQPHYHCEPRRSTSNAKQFAHFCGYQAVLPLYVYVIKHQSSPPSSWVPYFEAASRCQEQIKVSAEKESFSQKCSGVIEELRLEAVACIKKHGNYGHLPGVRSDVIRGEGQEGGAARDGEERMRGEGDGGGRGQDGRGTTSFFGGSWNDMNFDQSAPGGGRLAFTTRFSLFSSVLATSCLLNYRHPRLTIWECRRDSYPQSL